MEEVEGAILSDREYGLRNTMKVSRLTMDAD